MDLFANNSDYKTDVVDTLTSECTNVSPVEIFTKVMKSSTGGKGLDFPVVETIVIRTI